MMRWTILLAAVWWVVGCASRPAPVGPSEIALWPNETAATTQGSERIDGRGTADRPNRFIWDVRHAKLTLWPAPAKGATGTAIVVCPGGGYAGQAIDKEGTEIARWLNSIGATAVVLQYRLPDRAITGDGTPLPLLDAREAIRVVRRNAKAWRIDPHRIGIMGFSAGGHLGSMALTQPADAPADFGVLMYPVISMKEPIAHKGSKLRLLGAKPDPAMIDKYSSELQVTAQTPPTFICTANDDRGVLPENSVRFYEALRKAGVEAELVRFEKGGHGFGLGNGESSQWPGRCEIWMKEHGFLGR
jgi:acetyl esterase/lipase